MDEPREPTTPMCRVRPRTPLGVPVAHQAGLAAGPGPSRSHTLRPRPLPRTRVSASAHVVSRSGAACRGESRVARWHGRRQGAWRLLVTAKCAFDWHAIYSLSSSKQNGGAGKPLAVLQRKARLKRSLPFSPGKNRGGPIPFQAASEEGGEYNRRPPSAVRSPCRSPAVWARCSGRPATRRGEKTERNHNTQHTAPT